MFIIYINYILNKEINNSLLDPYYKHHIPHDIIILE